MVGRNTGMMLFAHSPREFTDVVAALQLHNIGIVVEDLSTVVAFFVELGLEVEGETTVEGPWVDSILGLDGVRSDIVMLRTPDGRARLELSRFHSPAPVPDRPDAPPNALGLRRLLFAVPDLEDVVARLRARGAELLGDVTRIEDSYLMCYLRGPEGLIVALAQELH